MPRERIVSVSTKFPKVESVYSPSDQQSYNGGINILSIIELKKDVLCCKYTEDNNNLAAGFDDGTIKVFNCKSGECKATLLDDEIRLYPSAVTAIKHRPCSVFHQPTDRLLSSYINGCLKCWKYKSIEVIYTIREKRQTLGLSYHPRVQKFVSYGDDATLNMYDEETQTQERSFFSSFTENKLDGHSSNIYGCAINPKSNHELISGGWDGRVMCWDDRQPYATKHFQGVHVCGEGIDFDKSGKTILTCSWRYNDNIQLWDYGSCKLIANVLPDSVHSRLHCGTFLPQSNLVICGGSDDHLICLIDPDLNQVISSVKNNPGAILSLDLGKVRRKDQKLNTYRHISKIPMLSYVTGNSIHTVDFQ